MLRLFRALSAIVALIAIALVSALVTMRLAIHKAEVRVPDVSGLTVPEAAARLRTKKLESGVNGRFFSTTVAEGHVLTQSPPAGTLVRKSFRVRMTVSLGRQKTAIPSVAGMDEDIATITIRRTGLRMGDVATMPFAYAPQNSVIAQTPLANAKDVQGPEIGILTASQPLPPVKASVMPNLTGETFTAAALEIVRAGFVLAPLENPLPTLPASSPASAPTKPSGTQPGAISPVVQNTVPSGTVIAQNPIAGTRVVAGATIQLTVQP